jgi:hypothetical protein
LTRVPQLDIGRDLDSEFTVLGDLLPRGVAPFGPLVLFSQSGDVIVDEDQTTVLEAEAP